MRQDNWQNGNTHVALAADAFSDKDSSVDRDMVVKTFTTMAQARDYLY